MERADAAVLEGLRGFDSATVFNALVKVNGRPNLDYTDHTIRCLTPELVPFAGYAVTLELTTNDDDSPALPFESYYQLLEDTPGPLVAVIRDVDSDPGRGASFGDGMATVHKRLGVVGVIVDGTVRDLAGIRQVGLPVMAWGTVPGHGTFHFTRCGEPLTVGQLRVRPGDLLVADTDGCVRVPVALAARVLEAAGSVRRWEREVMDFYASEGFTVAEMRRRDASR